MKKLLSFWVAVIMLTASFSAVFGADDITVMLDGTKLEFDVQPRIINDRTMVPMRAIFEALDAEVMWDETTKTVTADKENTNIMMTIGEEMIFVNYSPVILDAPPQIIGDRTLVPLRAAAESFDCNVDWNDSSRTVTITTDIDAQSGNQDSPENSAVPKETATPEKTAEPKDTDTAEATKAPSKTASPEETTSPEETAAPEETPVPEKTTVSEENTPTEKTDLAEDAEADVEEEISEDEEATEETEINDTSEDITIRYEAGYELSSHSAGGFRITSIRTTSDGKYEIEYFLQTFQDDSGKQVVMFDCLDENDKVIDSFGGYFYSDAYTWSDQTGTAVISGKTAKIRLSEENQK